MTGRIIVYLACWLITCCGCRAIWPDAVTVAPLPEQLQLAYQFVERGEYQPAIQLLRPYFDKPFTAAPYGKALTHALYLWGRIVANSQGETATLPAEIQPYVAVCKSTNMTERVTAWEKMLPRAAPEILPWLHVELALARLNLYEYQQAEKHIDVAMRLLPDFAPAHLLQAYLALRKADWAKALECARLTNRLNADLIKPYFFEAANQLILGDYSQALHMMKRIQILFPTYRFNLDEWGGLYGAFYHETLQLLREDLVHTALPVVEEALRNFATSPTFWGLKAEILMRLHREEEAYGCVRTALRSDPYHLPSVRLCRRLLIKRREYRQAFSLWKRLVPDSIFADEQNPVRARYLELEKTINMAKANVPATLLPLARALARFGWEEEAMLVYGQIQAPEVAVERTQLRRHLQFLTGIKKLMHRSYETNALNIVDIIARINRMARELGIPLRTWPSQELSSYFLVVRELDPFDPLPGSLGAYLAEYNKCFDLGNNYGYIEARLGNRLAVKSHTRPIWGKPCQYRVILTDETELETYLGYHSKSSEVAGRAFLSSKGFYIALDTVRPNKASLQDLYAHLSESSPIEIPSIPPDDFPYIPGLADALMVRSFQKVMARLPAAQDKWDMLYAEVLQRRIDVIHHHELGHTVDFPCFLPVYASLGEIWRMLVRQNFSPQNIHTRFETVAEIFGLAHAEDPHYYLYREMDRLNVSLDGIFGLVYWAWYGKLPQQDPYYRTAVKIFRRLDAYLHEKEGLARLADYTPDQLRELGTKLCTEEEIVKRCQD